MGGGPRQVRLTVFGNEALARLAEQRLSQERIPCVVRSLGAGPGGWGVATNLPHALYVLAEEEMLARQLLDIAPAEIAERGNPARPSIPDIHPYPGGAAGHRGGGPHPGRPDRVHADPELIVRPAA